MKADSNALHWDSLRYFLALHRHGRLVAAAKSLKVDQTTVGRRVRELESILNTQLFEKKEAGFYITEAGNHLLQYAETIEKAFMHLHEDVRDANSNVTGLVRISSPDYFDNHFLATELPIFLQDYPGLMLELSGPQSQADLTRREIDLLISQERPTDGNIVTRHLLEYPVKLFASHEYLKNHKPINHIDDLIHHVLINDGKGHQLEALEKTQKSSLISLTTTAQLNAALQGYGLCLLPEFIADRQHLKPILPEQIQSSRSLWLSMNQESRTISKVKTVSRFIGQAIANSGFLKFIILIWVDRANTTKKPWRYHGFFRINLGFRRESTQVVGQLGQFLRSH